MDQCQSVSDQTRDSRLATTGNLASGNSTGICRLETHSVAAASFTFSAAIPTPISKLFEILSDPTRIPTWMPHCHAAKSDGPLHKKSRVTLEFGRRTVGFSARQ